MYKYCIFKQLSNVPFCSFGRWGSANIYYKQTKSRKMCEESFWFEYQETNSSMQKQSTTIVSPAVSSDNEKLVLTSSRGGDINNSLPCLDLSLKPAFTPFMFQLWPPNAYSLKDDAAQMSWHKYPKETMKELVGMSQLTLGEASDVRIDSSRL